MLGSPPLRAEGDLTRVRNEASPSRQEANKTGWSRVFFPSCYNILPIFLQVPGSCFQAFCSTVTADFRSFQPCCDFQSAIILPVSVMFPVSDFNFVVAGLATFAATVGYTASRRLSARLYVTSGRRQSGAMSEISLTRPSQIHTTNTSFPTTRSAPGICYRRRRHAEGIRTHHAPAIPFACVCARARAYACRSHDGRDNYQARFTQAQVST